MSPSMLYTPSTTTSLPLSSGRERSTRSRSSTSLWTNLSFLPKLSRQPSRMLAWSMRSVITYSPRSTMLADHAEIGLEPGGEDDRRRQPDELGQFLLEHAVDVETPVEEARPGAPGPVVLGGVDRGLLDLGVVRQTEITVRPEHQDRLAVDGHHRVLRRRNLPEVRIDPERFDHPRLVEFCRLDVERQNIGDRRCRLLDFCIGHSAGIIQNFDRKCNGFSAPECGKGRSPWRKGAECRG